MSCTSIEKNKLRAVVIVLDGVGVGPLPDAGDYGDEGVNSVAHAAYAAGGLHMPTFEGMGLGNITSIEGIRTTEGPTASWGSMAEVSPGKDSISGHWELMGCPLSEPFPTYPDGFPDEIIGEFERKTGLKILGNRPASGTEIIEELGPEHIRTGRPIVYTSADSVFQIAAHDDVIPLERLYRLCRTAREMLVRPHHVARVIARPFTGEPGTFARTMARRDFALPPPADTLLDILSRSGYRVVTVGKIHDLFACRGIDEIVKARGNDEAMKFATDFIRGGNRFSFLFTNLIDFDMLWGHRRNYAAYAHGLEEVDRWLGDFIERLEPGTLLCITADHGCDPTYRGSDHTREYVPILAKFTGADRGGPLGTRTTLSDLAATLADFFHIDITWGKSFLDLVG